MSSYQPGAEIAGRFIIKERIGEGGMGAVYRALQTSLDREVALKVLHSSTAMTPRARRRFGREARAIARLNHPHIAGVYDFGMDDDGQTLWLAMELISGRSLTVLKREPVDMMRLLSLTDQILSALAAAHARGIIHRDMKPSNVLLTRDDEGREIIKLVDFGLAATQDGELTLEGAPGDLGDDDSEAAERTILGTPRYMAPEIFKRAPTNPQVDLYALGVMLYEILAGEPPFPGDDPRALMRAHMHETIPRLLVRGGVALPPDLEHIIRTLMAKDTGERYQTAASVRDAVAPLVAEFSHVPWAMGPRAAMSAGNTSGMGFLSSMGGQTVPPSSMFGGVSTLGAVMAQQAPLVGRLAERRALEHRLRAALADSIGSLVLLDGEAGVGKSRLLQWLRVRVEEAGVMRVVAGAYSATTSGFEGLRAVLEDLLGVRNALPNQLSELLSGKLSRWGFSAEEQDACLRLMRPSREESAREDVTGERAMVEQERVFATAERILRRVAAERPLLILLEDLHHAGQATLGFLEHVAVGLHLTPAPIVLLGALRVEEIEQTPKLRQTLDRLSRFGSEDIVRLSLKRLSQDESVELIHKHLPLADELAYKLATRAEGNPLYITQMLRFLQDSGKLQYDSGRWTLQEGVQLTREIPDALAEMLRFRAAEVCRRWADPEAMRAVLSRCAVLGWRVEYRLLRALVHAEQGQPFAGVLDAALEALVRSGLLREAGTSGDDVLEFDHRLMRDVLLQDMEERRVERALHLQAAEIKVAQWRDRIGDRALEIAEHYRMARNPHGVYIYTLKAARQAQAACDLRLAMTLFRQAEELVGTLDEASQPLTSADAEPLAGPQVALEVAHLERRLGEYDAARQDYRKLLISTVPAVALWARWGLGELSQRQGDYDESVGWFEAARREAVRAMQFPQPGHEQLAGGIDAYCLFGLGCVAAARGELSAASLTLGEALEKSQKIQDRGLEADVLRSTSDVCWRMGEVDRAEVYRRRAALLADSFGDRESQAQGIFHSAEHLRNTGRVADAELRAGEAMSIFEALGKRHHVAHCLLLLGELAWLKGDYKEAAQLLRKAHRFYELFRDRRGLTECKQHLASLALSIKRYPNTQTLARDAAEGFRAMGDRRGEALTGVLVGRLELAMQKYDRAARSFLDAASALEHLHDVRGALTARLWSMAALESADEIEQVDSALPALFTALDGAEIADEPTGAALAQLAEVLGARRPDLAMDADERAERVWQRLGRPLQIESAVV
jgi:eukaryotic-like serine/threonine-protein kinase